jgi:lipoprotein-anchoring transpeptidase ErfK/SrfK
LQTFRKAKTGASFRNAFAMTLAVTAALFVVGTADEAEAQLFPWGWQKQPPWKPQQRRQRRVAPRYAEPKDEKVTSTLPKPEKPLLIVVSLGSQTVTVYDGLKKVVTAPISSGMRGHETPTGIFSLLEKNRTHYSNLYGGAPMPFMQRVTNSGVALHAGQLPGYPASHGCVRLPYSFARNLFGITDIGARVIITNDNPAPVEFTSAHLIQPLPPGEEAKTGFNIVGVTPAAAEVPHKVRTRAVAAAERAAKRDELAAAITVAEGGKKSADDYVKLTTDLARDAKNNIAKARHDADRRARAAKKAERLADKAMDRFSTLTRKLAAVDVAKLDPAELEKQSAEELAEEGKALDAVDDARAARALAAKQKRKIAKAIAASEATEKVRKSALADQKTAVQALADARAALASAQLIEERKDYPVSIFVSGKTGRLVAKLGFKQVIDVPVKIADAGQPLGTHVLTATGYTEGEKSMRWSAVTYQPTTKRWQPRRRHRHADEETVVTAGPDADAASALERIDIPAETREQLAELMKPGSSFIISDYGLSRETSDRTEFVIEPWRSRPGDSGRTVDYY